jgi:hypothetical protein
MLGLWEVVVVGGDAFILSFGQLRDMKTSALECQTCTCLFPHFPLFLVAVSYSGTGFIRKIVEAD